MTTTQIQVMDEIQIAKLKLDGLAQEAHPLPQTHEKIIVVMVEYIIVVRHSEMIQILLMEMAVVPVESLRQAGLVQEAQSLHLTLAPRSEVMEKD